MSDRITAEATRATLREHFLNALGSTASADGSAADIVDKARKIAIEATRVEAEWLAPPAEDETVAPS